LYFHEKQRDCCDILTARELLGWSREQRFDRCSLFAMLACWGLRVDAKSDWQAREVIGLASSLFQRGVASILGSLWPATISSASVLFYHFFAEYLQGQAASTALRRAQLELRRDQKHSFQDHPYFWAPFYLMGDYKAWP
jgi:hypothetical protein